MTAIKKNIILTGSEGLIGKAYRKFAEKKGHKVFCLDLKNIKRNNYFKCNIVDEISVKQTINNILRTNKIDVLINNASFNPKVEKKLKVFKFSNYNYEKWKKGLEVDLNGSFLISKYILKHFESRNSGIILNIASIYGVIGPDQDIYSNKNKRYHGTKPLEYSVAKAGIIGFTKSLAAFYKNTNIRVNCLVFGGVKNKKQNQNFLNKYSQKTIIGRLANINEYNNYIEFFSSKENTYTTGSCFAVDGGATSIF